MYLLNVGERYIMSNKRYTTRMIYSDPLTEKRPEGEATLMVKLDFIDLRLELWRVKFIKGGVIATRSIRKTEGR